MPEPPKFDIGQIKVKESWLSNSIFMQCVLFFIDIIFYRHKYIFMGTNCEFQFKLSLQWGNKSAFSLFKCSETNNNWGGGTMAVRIKWVHNKNLSVAWTLGYKSFCIQNRKRLGTLLNFVCLIDIVYIHVLLAVNVNTLGTKIKHVYVMWAKLKINL